MFNITTGSSSLLPSDKCSCQTSGWRGNVDMVSFALNVTFSWVNSSLIKKEEKQKIKILKKTYSEKL